MTSFQQTPILKISAVILLLISVAGLLIFHSRLSSNQGEDPISVYILAILFLNASILSSWQSFGSIGGVLFLLASSFIMLLVARSSKQGFAPFISSFFVAGALGYVYLRTFEVLERSSSLKTEKIREEINIQRDSIKKKEFDVDSFRKKFARYATLKEVAEALGTTLSGEEISTLVINSAIRIIGKSDRALVFLVDSDKQELALHASRLDERFAKIKEKKGNVFDAWVLKQRKPLIIEDTDSDFRFSQEALNEAKRYFRSLISAPLVIEGKVTGVLRLDSIKKSSYNQDDLRLLDVIADFAAISFENNRLYKRTEELAIKDGLTDLVVHRYFKERLVEETARAGRSKATFSLLIVDVDNFKDYNDRFGHISGDIVLRYLAGILKGSVKEGDVVARYGGEEFALILVGRPKDLAVEEAEAVRKKIEREPLVLRREKTRLTVSIGVANFPSDTLVPEELIKKADARMYKAKKEGRNRVSG